MIFMKKILVFLVLVFVSFSITAQSIPRPKLVVGIVIDQMRWDYLYRYYDRYAENGGFKRLLNQGFSCENTFIPYAPTVTACGHASIYTGSVPAINGITGNFWFDFNLNKSIYCTEDSTVKTLGSSTAAGQESPKNLLVTTIGDELRLATNFRSKVVGIALKDRASILPAGHSPNSAYWFDPKEGVWITSDYYTKTLPGWVKNFRSKQMIDSFYNEGWKTLFPINTYLQSTADVNQYEGKPFGTTAKGFPYDLKSNAGTNYHTVLATPFGSTLTAEFAKQAIINEQLGQDDITDLLALSFSSPDYVGHSFGPNSIEQEDNYLRLDKDLGSLLDFLDSRIGKDQYTIFLSADHGVAHVPAFLKDHGVPAGSINFTSLYDKMSAELQRKFGKDNIILDIANLQVSLNVPLMEASSIKEDDVKKWISDFLVLQPGIDRVIDMENFDKLPLNSKMKTMFANGYNPNRSGQLQIILNPQWMEGAGTGGTTHGLWNPYDSHIPLVWYGWGIKQGKLNRETYMTDIAATLAALLHIQMPSGTVGKVITEAFK